MENKKMSEFMDNCNKIISMLDEENVKKFYSLIIKHNMLDFALNKNYSMYNMNDILTVFLNEKEDNSFTSFIKFVDDNKENYKLVK